MMEASLLFAGLFGGVIRGLVGYLKYHFRYKNITFKWSYFLIMVGFSGIIGVASGWLVKGLVPVSDLNSAYAFLAGYAGGDFMENAFKIILKKPELFKMPELLKSK